MFSTFRQWLRPTNKLSRGNRRRNARRELLRLESLEGRHLLTVGLFEAHFDFGTSSSPVAAGYTPVPESVGYGAHGYGWLSGQVSSRDRAAGSALERDFNFTQHGTFAVDLPNGRYAVEAVFGDLGRYGHDQMGVFLEGGQVDNVSTAGGQVVRRQYEVDVADGQLTLQLQDLGGADANAVIEALDISMLEQSVPGLSINDVPQFEGDTGVQNQVFTVSLSHAVASDVSVSFAVESSTALAPDDFTAQTGVLTIPAGAASGTIVVQIKGDTIIEPNETYLVRLSNPQGAQLVDDLGVGTILNDDA
ncbi:MAG: Calx-beta domain-containing protein, partial [Pirellulaceae bacterium]